MNDSWWLVHNTIVGSFVYLRTISEPKAWDSYPTECQGFRRLSDRFRRFPETSEDVLKNSEVLKCHDTFAIDWKRTIFYAFFPSQSANLRLKRDLHGLFLSQKGSSLHSSVVNGSFKRLVHICESGVRNWSAGVICREIKVLVSQAWESRSRRESWQV